MFFPNFYYFALAFAGLVLIVSLFRKESRVARLLRLCSLLILLGCLFEPVLEFTFAAKPWFLVLVDTSRSMGVGGRLQEAGRIVSQIRSRKEVYGFNSHPYLLGIGDSPIPATMAADGELTSIGNALLETPSPSAYLLLSDGVNNFGPDPVSAAERENIPVYTIKIGDSTTGDVGISGITCRKIAYAGDEVPVRIRLENTGYSGHEVEILLKEDDRVLSKKEIVLAEWNGQNEAEFSVIVGAPGLSSYEVSVSDMPDEINRENNRREFGITVLKSRIKVGWFSNTPTWNLRFARLELARDSRVELHWWVKIADGKWISRNGAVSAPDYGTPYDVVVLENFDCHQERPLITTDAGIITIGKTCQRLSPFILGPLPEAGCCSVHVLAGFGIFETRELPPLREIYPARITGGETRVLCATHEGAPLVVKRGSTIGIAANDIWRWSFAPALRFWSKIVKAVALKGPALFVHTEPVVEAGEKVIFEVDAYSSSYAPDPNRSIVAKISGADSTYSVPLYSLGTGKYQGVVEFLPPGKYEYEVVTQGQSPVKDSFLVTSQLELQRLGPDEKLLRRLSHVSGGKHIEDVEELQRALTHTRSVAPFHPSRSFFCLLLIILLLTTEWFWLRK